MQISTRLVALVAGVVLAALLPAGASAAVPADRRETPRIAGAATTGVPAAQRLRPYRGPCTITRDGTRIVGRTVGCDLRIRARGVRISRSYVAGTIATSGRGSFRLVRSTVDASPGSSRMVTVVGESRFRVVRSEIRGGNRSINCWDRCLVRHSWVHGQDTDATGRTHESGIRMGTRGRFIGNRIACDAPNVAPDAGCSAPLTGYGDYGPVRDNLVQGNLFVATTGGTCAYGGSSGGKPYSGHARGIRFIDNRFERGSTRRCGYWEPVMDFDRSAPGNVFTGNRWIGGGRVRP
ncbi:hypothetical protein [Nocardioides lianchengensis]|uniref:Right handed beta helix region n=1 Tax=Nocardioides lianchengensis TaxID=1045774 RepID=A0A1G6VS84_9ACTN|nr:hypothetical protein [Nocardioides lianchengensis]NYG11273.1 hypothetical protein [Nocardioides lianchengensis]SDD56283.1 hypothetical protein SAMN05421872_10929 [Nocardioides lianchengensis]